MPLRCKHLLQTLRYTFRKSALLRNQSVIKRELPVQFLIQIFAASNWQFWSRIGSSPVPGVS